MTSQDPIDGSQAERGDSPRGFVNILQEFSIPLLSGVVVAMLAANLAPEW
jgi:hypothetical protein